MRFAFLLVLITFPVLLFSQEKKDSLANKLEPYLNFSLNSNGIAPIPAFSLDKPAVIANVGVAKGRFSYDPGLAYGLDGKAWYIDSWLHYKIISRPKFELKLGVNFSSYFSPDTSLSGIKIKRSERYFTFSLTCTRKLSPSSSLSFDYWSDNGQESMSIRGHFFDIVYDRSEIALGQKALLGVNLMLFYINYTGNNDGLFFSPKVSLGLRHFPASLFIQSSQAFSSDIVPFPGFRWNLGISYTL
jgi:hypothetical protein